MEFEYKVTVIIPVYNAEKTLPRTMDSLFQQTIAQSAMEILLIDDGSKDGSPQLCDKYAEDHYNVQVIHQENKGVSAARNAGIRAAKGKYLLYLDSDDTLSAETLKNLTTFFDVHYDEVDVVTYPIVNIRNGQPVPPHFRYTQYLTETGVYALNKYPYIAQTTINVCEKNISGNPMFDETVKLGEDQLHDTLFLARKGKIGYVREAQYTYFHEGENTTNKLLQPEYSFEPYMELFCRLMEIKAPNMFEYCIGMILYNVSWRITSNVFFPSHLRGAAYDEAVNQLRTVIEQIPSSELLRYPHMPDVHIYFLLSLKRNNRPFLILEDRCYTVADLNGQLACHEKVLISVTRSCVEKGKLKLMAYEKFLPKVLSQCKVKVYAIINGFERRELTPFYSKCNYFYSNIPLAQFSGLHLEIDLAGLDELSFEVEVNGHAYPTYLWFMHTQPLRADEAFYLTDGKYKVYCKDNTLRVKRGYFKGATPPVRAKISLCRTLFGRSHKRIWLYNDRVGVLDNGYFQFLHDYQKKDGIRRYYVYDEDKEDIVKKLPPEVVQHLVRFGSFCHKMLYANAEYILTSFVDSIYYRPFDADTFQYYAGRCKAKVIYLQHGVLHGKTPHYAKERLEIDKVVISGEYERDVFTKECNFLEDDLILSGMPRLDEISINAPPQKKILYAPSWRSYLTKGLQNLRWLPVAEETVCESDYFKGMVKFLNHKPMLDALRKKGYTIELKLHPIFEMYKDIFITVLPEGVSLAGSNVQLEEYTAFITDFSSFLYDFAYLRRPIYYFIPDYTDIKAGRASFADFYIPPEDGLGFFSTDAIEMADRIVADLSAGFVVSQKYLERMRKIFADITTPDMGHRDILYQTLEEDSHV